MTMRKIELLEAQLDAWQMLAASLAGHLAGAIDADKARADGMRACCPDCAVTVQRYLDLRDGRRKPQFDPSTIAYAGDPRQR